MLTIQIYGLAHFALKPNGMAIIMQCFAMALAMLCDGTCNALREIIHVILKNDIVFHGDDNYKIVYIKKKPCNLERLQGNTPCGR